MTGLEDKIFNFIEKQYNVKFKGEVKVKINNDEYCLELILNNYMAPLVICSQAITEDNFFQYICKELKERKLTSIDYLHLKLIH